MTDPFDVLVVCVGNLCRSPLAERLLRQRLTAIPSEAPAVRVTSAGSHAVIGDPMDFGAATELVRLGGDPTGFSARQLTGEMVRSADLVLTATRELRGRVVTLVPVALKRTFTIRELASLLESPPWPGDVSDLPSLISNAADWRAAVAHRGDQLDVPDPIGGSAALHRISADSIDASCSTIVAVLRGLP